MASENILLDILKENPNDSETLHLLGLLKAKQEKFLEAKNLLEQAIAISPNIPEFQLALGSVFRKLGDLDRAMTHFQKAIDLKPDYANAYNNLGNIYWSKNALAKAEENYQQAVNIKNDYSDAHYNLALIYKKQNLLVKTREHLDIILQFEPLHQNACLLKAQLLQQAAESEAAVEYYEKYLQTGSEDLEVLNNIALSYLAIGNRQKALKYFLRLTMLKPDAEVATQIGIIYMENDHHQEAIQYFETALTLEPKSFSACYNLASVYLKLPDYENAAKYYRQALSIQPQNQEVSYMLDAISDNNQTPTAAPRQYVQNLFDQYAPYYDKHLVGVLDYQVPMLVMKAIDSLNLKQTEFSILDLGCGTGLMGEKMQTISKRMVGIDLSVEMLTIAHKKNIYDMLYEGDILDLLDMPMKNSGKPKCEGYKIDEKFDFIIATDVLGYFGDLSELFQKVTSKLTSIPEENKISGVAQIDPSSLEFPRGGKERATGVYNPIHDCRERRCQQSGKPKCEGYSGYFAFTIEKTAVYPYELQKTARFAHSEQYLNELIIQNALQLQVSQTINLRKNRNQPVLGSLFICKGW